MHYSQHVYNNAECIEWNVGILAVMAAEPETTV